MRTSNQKISEKTLNITRHFDHTCLCSDTNANDIFRVCCDAVKYECASVCVPPYFASLAKSIINEIAVNNCKKPKVCTVIGFPFGYNTLGTKINEIREVAPYADEIDIVINQCLIKSNEMGGAFLEIKVLKTYARALGIKTIKVIVETCNLTKSEKFNACVLCVNTGVDYIKTSTGFGKAGAQIEDIRLFKNIINISKSKLKIKASGGINTIEDAKCMIAAGASRIGSSKLLKRVGSDDL